MKRCPTGINNCGGNWVQRQIMRFGSNGGGGEIPLGYGLLYNWYAATDERGVAPSGFRVPEDSDVDSLLTEVGGDTGNKIRGTRSIGPDLQTPVNHPGWQSGNLGLDTEGFRFYAFGIRSGDVGGLEGIYRISLTGGDDQDQWGRLLTSTTVGSGSNIFVVTYNITINQSQALKSTFGGADRAFGCSIRCVSDSEPPTPTVTDNDGNEYSWVQIGSQYWLQQNLKTTTYNNGDAIPTGLDDAAWAATTDGAWAYPNGDSNLPI